MHRLTTVLRCALAALVLLLADAAGAQDRDTIHSAHYADLMQALAGAATQPQADRIAARIWQIWLTAPDEVAQAVLDSALRHRKSYDFRGAIKDLDRLIEAYPDYAEGWNQRAPMYFMRGDYPASLADVAEVLALEPRHFGALSGKAIILYRQGKLALARIAVHEALKVHPFLHERALLDVPAGTDL